MFSKKTVENAKIGVSKALSKGWVRIDKGQGEPFLHRKVSRRYKNKYLFLGRRKFLSSTGMFLG